MVRFNDKAQISSLANNDIMPITDMSDSTDDKKVTIQQLTDYVNNAIPSNKFANLDLSNLSTTGQSILDSKLDKTQITNCILEIPQNIKLEFVDGVLTLKSGSVVVVPNGKSGSTLLFTQRTIPNDISASVLSNGSGLTQIMVNINNTFAPNSVNMVSSGDTAPSSGQIWYDTTNNLIKSSSDNGSSWNTTVGVSLPIGLITRDTGTITSLNQIFNGFGTIGSTFFSLPNVKGLIPNGRNTDGTLNNIEYNPTTVQIFTEPATFSYKDKMLFLGYNGRIVATAVYYFEGLEADKPTSFSLNPAGRVVYYSKDTNKLYTTLSNNVNWISISGVYSGRSTWNHLSKQYSFIPNETINLSNIEVVHKFGNETIEGIKTFTEDIIMQKSIDSYRSISCNCDTVDYTNLQNNQTGIRIISRDKNNQYFATIESIVDYNGSLINRLGARRNINGEDVVSTLNLYISENGNTFATAPTYTINYSDNSNLIVTTAYMANHWCVTTPTTTSTASKERPAVVVENYINGTSWYRVWSDGWIEQGLQGEVGTNSAPKTLIFLKSFKDTKYYVNSNYGNSYTGNIGTSWAVYPITIFPSSENEISVKSSGSITGIQCRFYACGY